MAQSYMLGRASRWTRGAREGDECRRAWMAMGVSVGRYSVPAADSEPTRIACTARLRHSFGRGQGAPTSRQRRKRGVEMRLFRSACLPALCTSCPCLGVGNAFSASRGSGCLVEAPLFTDRQRGRLHARQQATRRRPGEPSAASMRVGEAGGGHLELVQGAPERDVFQGHRGLGCKA